MAAANLDLEHVECQYIHEDDNHRAQYGVHKQAHHHVRSEQSDEQRQEKRPANWPVGRRMSVPDVHVLFRQLYGVREVPLEIRLLRRVHVRNPQAAQYEVHKDQCEQKPLGHLGALTHFHS